MRAKLVVVGGDTKTTEVDLRLPAILGRGREATLTLPHPLVSRQHCEITESDGRLIVRDLGSLNGTFVANERINETVLDNGQLLTVGTVTFRAVYLDAEASAPEISPAMAPVPLPEAAPAPEPAPAEPSPATVNDVQAPDTTNSDTTNSDTTNSDETVPAPTPMDLDETVPVPTPMDSCLPDEAIAPNIPNPPMVEPFANDDGDDDDDLSSFFDSLKD